MSRYRKRHNARPKKKMTNAKTGRGNIVSLVSLLLISALIFGGVFYWRFGGPVSPDVSKNVEEVTTKETQAPTTPLTPYPLPAKKVKYNISQSKHVGPTFSSVTFDPLSVNKGQNLVITTAISNSEPITEVNGTLQSDNKTTELKITKISGDDKKGEWKVTIKMDDTTLITYLLTLNAVSANGTSTIKVTPR